MIDSIPRSYGAVLRLLSALLHQDKILGKLSRRVFNMEGSGRSEQTLCDQKSAKILSLHLGNFQITMLRDEEVSEIFLPVLSG